jgi:hypothetical protein
MTRILNRLALLAAPVAACAILGACPPAAAQTASSGSPASTQAAAGTAITAPPATTTQHYDLQPPVFGAGPSSVYDLNVSPNQNGPAGTIAVTSTAPPLAYSFDQYARSIHGYVSTSVSSNGGHEFSGGVTLPIVPGAADLDVGLSTGQIGGFRPYAGNKTLSAGYDAYYAGLHIHPSDNFDAYIGVQGLRLANPQP